MGAWDPKHKFMELTVNFFSFLQLRVGNSDVIVSYFIVSNRDGRHGYYCGYRFVENSPEAVAHFLDAVDLGDEALFDAKPGGRPYAKTLPYSAKILAEGGGSFKFRTSAPTAVDGLQAPGKLGFVVVQQSELVHNVFWRVHVDTNPKAGKAEEFTLPMFVQKFPADIPAAVHPVSGTYAHMTAVLNNYSQVYAEIDRDIQRQLAGPPRWHTFDLSRFFTLPASAPPASS